MVTIRNNSLELEDGDTISVGGTELTFRSSGELEFPDGETAISLSDIDGADIAPNSVDADSVSASNELTIPTYSADSGVPNDVLYYHTGQNQFRYKDSGGTVRGVDPSQLSLADLGSRSHSDLSDAPSSAHHAKTQSSDITLTDTQPGTVNNGEFLTNSGGNLTGGTVETEPNVPAWELDGTINDTSYEVTYTISDTSAEFYYVFGKAKSVGGSRRIGLQFNDVSNGHDYFIPQGEQYITGSSFIQPIIYASSDVFTPFAFKFYNLENNGNSKTGFTNQALNYIESALFGGVDNAGELTSITLKNPRDTNDINFVANVYRLKI